MDTTITNNTTDVDTNSEVDTTDVDTNSEVDMNDTNNIEWKWISVLDTEWMTSYAEKPYVHYDQINEKYKDITLNSLEKMGAFPTSPTGCRFTRNTEGKGIFFRDPENCYIWSQNPVTNQIIATSRDDSVYIVAHSLPEFLSHMDAEYREWWKTNK